MYSNKNNEKEFFIIDSEKLELVTTKLYGYVISGNKIYTDKNYSEDIQLTGNGTYVNVINTPDSIIISQDNYGSYSLYIYKKDEKYLISNSFIKLVEIIKEKQVITLNKEYSDSFLTLKQNISFDETIIKEITQIPKDYQIIINKKDRKIKYHNINNQEKTINPHTPETVYLIDNWFNQWINIIRNLCQQENNITINIDDTLSSRLILSLVLNSNINPKNIQITSNNITSKIIQELSEQTNLTIQKTEHENIKNVKESIEKSFNIKLSLNSQINLQNNSIQQEYYINNTNPYRNNENQTLEEIIKTYSNEAQYYSKKMGETLKEFSWNNIHKLQKHLKEYDIYSQEFHDLIYTHTILRNNLKNNIEKYLSNKITLNPLLDLNLQKIKTDKQGLYTLILQRYSPELLNITFTDENIYQETINNSIKINEKHPLKKQEYPYLEYFPKHNTNTTNKEDYSQEYTNLIRKVFFSNAFKHTFLKYYSQHTLNQIVKKYTEYDNYDINELNPSIAIMKIIEDIEYSQKNIIHNEYDWLKKFIIQETPKQDNLVTNTLLNKYNTARIDIKNEGSQTNQIKIYDISDESSKIIMPTWFTNDKGVGICLSSDKSELSFKIKCINEGNLKFNLRSLDIRDRKNKRFPIYIDYLSFKIDGEELLNENKLIWHDKPFTYSRKVFDSEIIEVELKWKPFSNMSNYE